MSQLDDILKEIWADDGLMGPVVIGKPVAKHQIKALFLELIEPDEEYDAKTAPDIFIDGMNALRMELRIKVDEL